MRNPKGLKQIRLSDYILLTKLRKENTKSEKLLKNTQKRTMPTSEKQKIARTKAKIRRMFRKK